MEHAIKESEQRMEVKKGDWKWERET